MAGRNDSNNAGNFLDDMDERVARIQEAKLKKRAEGWWRYVKEHTKAGESLGEANERLRRENDVRRTYLDGHQVQDGIETPEQLPSMKEVMRAMPNHIARSSLFAPVAPGRKRMHDRTILASRNDAVIKFMGKQLDESQADVWMQAMYEAAKYPLGELVIINRANFLKAIGRAPSGQNYKWLFRAMEDLSFAMLIIDIYKQSKYRLSIGQTHALHMINGFIHDEKRGLYALNIDIRWRFLYENKEFSLIDWNKRLQFGQHQNMAKALQRLIATSSNQVQRYGLDWLKAKMEYSGRMRDFRAALNTACKELKRLGLIVKALIENSTQEKEQLVIWLSK